MFRVRNLRKSFAGSRPRTVFTGVDLYLAPVDRDFDAFVEHFGLRVAVTTC
jgi:hypothetical protein